MATKRIRTSKGSCWSCKKRRVKCDLAKPVCRHCASAGTTCDYNSRLIRWSTKPSGRVPAAYGMIPRDEVRLTVSLDVCERRALDYFHLRVWPLLTTSKEPCAAPTPVALEHRVVLLAACVLSDSHRRLQDGGSRGQDALNKRRVECLAAVRTEIAGCCIEVKGTGTLIVLLFAVILLYFDDGKQLSDIILTPSRSSFSHLKSPEQRFQAADSETGYGHHMAYLSLKTRVELLSRCLNS